MDVTANGRSAIMSVVIVVGFIVLMAVPSVITYCIMSKSTSKHITSTSSNPLTRTKYELTGAISTADTTKEKVNHESLQKFVDRINSTISEYERISKQP